MSYADCIRISVSIFTPKAFSMRSAISPERSALPLSRLDRVGRETRKAPRVSLSGARCLNCPFTNDFQEVDLWSLPSHSPRLAGQKPELSRGKRWHPRGQGRRLELLVKRRQRQAAMQRQFQIRSVIGREPVRPRQAQHLTPGPLTG